MASTKNQQRPGARLYALTQLASDSSRFLDLRLQLKRKKTGEILLDVGGRWDRVSRNWDAAPARPHVVGINEAQVEIARSFARWLKARLEGRERKLILFGGGKRGGGKTFVFAMLMVAMCLAIPGAIVYMVSPTLDKRDEIERRIKENTPATWRTYQTKALQFWFVTGAVAKNLSGDVPESVKRGDADLVFLNEAQDMQVRVYSLGLPALRTGGLMLVAANPPDRNNLRGDWVRDLKDKIQDGTIAGDYVEVDPSLNENIDHGTMGQIAIAVRAIDKSASDADIDGLWRPVGDFAYPMWSKELVGTIPELGVEDITAQVLKRLVFVPYSSVCGGDFQGRPHQAGAVLKVIRDPSKPGPVYWFIDELIVEGTELHLSDEAYAREYAPETMLWVPDCSGEIHDSGRTGRTSVDILKSQRWNCKAPTEIVRPDRSKHPKNPPVDQRLSLAYLLMEQGRIMVEPQCEWLIESFRKCPLKKFSTGRRKPDGDHSHITDAATYPVWLLEPKAKRPRSSASPRADAKVFSLPSRGPRVL